jgi:hypothetical protein
MPDLTGVGLLARVFVTRRAAAALAASPGACAWQVKDVSHRCFFFRQFETQFNLWPSGIYPTILGFGTKAGAGTMICAFFFFFFKR